MSDRQKTHAAAAALDYVEDGMTIGLGSGSTAEIFVKLLAERVKDGLRVKGVPTSDQTAALARELGIELADVDHVDHIAVTIDGADEVDGRFQLIKGGGGRHLREKIIAQASDLMVVVVDEGKLVSTLGK
ncbi:MAG: ribose 5-phosphate isomerase A, partial [Thalassospira sp.]